MLTPCLKVHHFHHGTHLLKPDFPFWHDAGNGNVLCKNTYYERIFLFPHFKIDPGLWGTCLVNIVLANKIYPDSHKQIAFENLDSLTGRIPLAILPDNSFLLAMWMSGGRSGKSLSPVLISECIQNREHDAVWGIITTF